MTDTQKKDDGSLLLSAVQAVAISPEKALKIVAQYRKAARKTNPAASDTEVEKLVSNKIINRYSKYASLSGGVSALPGVIPGVGSLVSMFGGGFVDMTACMKIQVDMTMLLATNFGWDLNDHDAIYMTMLIAVVGSLEKMGVGVGVPVASKAGVKMLQQYLKGATLIVLKQFLGRFGLQFTRIGLEKIVPLGVGLVASSGLNYAFTQYVGHEAVKCFTIERQMRQHPESEKQEDQTTTQAAE